MSKAKRQSWYLLFDNCILHSTVQLQCSSETCEHKNVFRPRGGAYQPRGVGWVSRNWRIVFGESRLIHRELLTRGGAGQGYN